MLSANTAVFRLPLAQALAQAVVFLSQVLLFFLAWELELVPVSADRHLGRPAAPIRDQIHPHTATASY